MNMPPSQNPQLPDRYPPQPPQGGLDGLAPLPPLVPHTLPTQPQPGASQQPGAAPQPFVQPQPPTLPQPQQPAAISSQQSYAAPKPSPTDRPPAGTPYDFFMQQQKPPKKNLIGNRVGKGTSSLAKILLGAAGLFGVLIILAIILSISRSGKDTAATGLADVAASQQEILRVSMLGDDQVTSQNLVNFTATAEVAITTDQQNLISFAAKHKVKIDPKVLALSKNPRVDSLLTASKAANTYEPTFTTVMQQLLASYKSKAQTVHDAALSQSEQALLEKDISNVTLLQTMLSQ